MSAPHLPAVPTGGAWDAPRTPVNPGAWDDAAAEAARPGAWDDTATEVARPASGPGTAVAPPRRGAADPVAPPRRGPADPVRALMHRHRELCERAVDPLEIAAGLEAHGVTDRTAARFRHRDVFSLAEELYARVPRAGGAGAKALACEAPASAGWIGYALLPGVACALTALGLELTGGRVRWAVGLTGVLVVAVALALCLRHGPLRAEVRTTPAARLYVCWLLGYAVLGDGLLGELVAGGPDGPWPGEPARAVVLAAAAAPAAWCAHVLAVQARRRLAASRGTEDFGASVRPLVLGLAGLFTGALVCLHVAVDAVGGPGATGGGERGPAVMAAGVALGVLLFLARLLTVHGFPRPASLGLAAATAVQVTALCSVLAARLPGLGLVGRPVERLVAAGGAAAVPAFACAVAALALLVHATAALSRASAHAGRARPGDTAPGRRPDGAPGPDGPGGPDACPGPEGAPRRPHEPHGPH